MFQTAVSAERNAFLGAGLFVCVKGQLECVSDINGVISLLERHLVNGNAYSVDVNAACFCNVHAFGQTAAAVQHYRQVNDTVAVGAGIEDALCLDTHCFLEKIGALVKIVHRDSPICLCRM